MSRPWHALRRPLLALLAGLLLVVAWDAAGADLPLDRLFGSTAGFAWRDNVWTSRVLHDGGRWLAGVVLALLVVDLLRRRAVGPSRRQRLAWLAVVLVSLLLVPLVKRYSLTSCPWDLAEFGGTASYVPHWLLGQSDGGPGHCFPSGHAVSAFGFFGLYFLWRDHDARRARGVLAAVLVCGALFGAAQVMRGAHHVSHVLWSAWLCWGVACAAAVLQLARRGTPAIRSDELHGNRTERAEVA